jgi:hypothetical protein
VNAAAAEALADPRIGPVSQDELETEAARWDAVETEVETEAEVEEARRGRVIEWATQTVTQGQVLDTFHDYCRDELDDVDVFDATPSRLELAWRRERSTVEVARILFCERLAAEGLPTTGPIGPKATKRFLDDETPSRVALLDLSASRRSPPFGRASSCTSNGPTRCVWRQDPARQRLHERPGRARIISPVWADPAALPRHTPTWWG